MKNRKGLQKYWESLGIVEVVTKQMLSDPSLLKPEVADLFKEGMQVLTSTEEWKIQGI